MNLALYWPQKLHVAKQHDVMKSCPIPQTAPAPSCIHTFLLRTQLMLIKSVRIEEDILYVRILRPALSSQTTAAKEPDIFHEC